MLFSRWCERYDLYNTSYPTSDHAVPFKMFYMLAEGMICSDAKNRMDMTTALVIARIQTHSEDRGTARETMQAEADIANGHFHRD